MRTAKVDARIMRNPIGLLSVLAVALALFTGPALAQCVGDPAPRLQPSVCDPAPIAAASWTFDGEHARVNVEEGERRGWLDVGMGWGRLHVGDDRSSDGGSLILDFTVGRWVSEGVAIGARLGGWTLESFSMFDPREGESLSEASGLLKVRPLARQPLMITRAGGWASYTANDPAALELNGDGVGWRAELEWDAWRPGRWSLGTGLAASWGTINPDSRTEADFGYGDGGLFVRARWRW